MHPELKAHPEYFKKEVVQLADNVYQAFGFAASNVYMIIGDDGLIIVCLIMFGPPITHMVVSALSLERFVIFLFKNIGE